MKALAKAGELSLPAKFLDNEFAVLKAIIATLVIQGHRYLTLRGGDGYRDEGPASRRDCAYAYWKASKLMRLSAEGMLRGKDSRYLLWLRIANSLQPDSMHRTHSAEKVFAQLSMSAVALQSPLAKFEWDKARAACELERVASVDKMMINAVATALSPICCS